MSLILYASAYIRVIMSLIVYASAYIRVIMSLILYASAYIRVIMSLIVYASAYIIALHDIFAETPFLHAVILCFTAINANRIVFYTCSIKTCHINRMFYNII